MDIIIFAVFTLLSFSSLTLAYVFGRPHEYFFLVLAAALLLMTGIQVIGSGLDVTYALAAATSTVDFTDTYVVGLGTLYLILAMYCVLGLIWGMRGKEARVAG